MKSINKIIFSTVIAAALSSCGDSTDDTPPAGTTTAKQSVVIAGATSDYSTASMSIIDASATDKITNELNASSKTDVALDSYGQTIYRLERYNANNITKFDINALDKPIWQCSTEGNETNSNPYQIIQISTNKAYVLRYGSGKLWVVDPSIAGSSECATKFKTAEIDLSAFDADGIPDMSSAVLVNDRLFVALQRLTSFSPSQASQVVVINTQDNSIVDTDPNTQGTQAITLIGKNAGKISYLGSLDKVFVQSVGKYANNYSNPATPAEYIGGIDVIDPTTFKVTQLIDDTQTTTQQISDMSLINSNKAYLVSYAGYKDNTLYEFNPSTGNITADTSGNLTAIASLANINITKIVKGPSDTLWVGVDSGVKVINTLDNTIIETFIDTKMNPSDIVIVNQ